MRKSFIKATLWIGLTLLTLPLAAQDFQIVSEEFPPYNYTKNGEFTGASTEVVMAVLKELRITPEIKVYPWARAYKMAQRDSNTLIFSIGRNEKREDLFHWVGVIAPANFYLFALQSREDISIAALEEAKKYKIGTVLQDVREQYLLSHGFDKRNSIYSSNSYEANLKLLLKGRIDLWAMSELAAYYLLEQNGLDRNSTLKKAYFLDELSRGGYYMAFNKQTPLETVNRFRSALQKVKDDGTYQKILDKYVN